MGGRTAHLIGPGVGADLDAWGRDLEATYRTWLSRRAWTPPRSVALLVAYQLEEPDQPGRPGRWGVGVCPAPLADLDAVVDRALVAAGLVADVATVCTRRTARYLAGPGVAARTDVWVAPAEDWERLEVDARTQVPFGVRHADEIVPPDAADEGPDGGLRLVAGQ